MSPRSTIRPPAARLSVAVLVASAVLAATALTACGSTSHSSLLGSAKQRACTAVADVLSDGPDPGADPVGYAEAQPLNLDQLTISDATLEAAVRQLADAYQAFASSTAGSAARKADTAAVATAAGKVNAICPGAAQ